MNLNKFIAKRNNIVFYTSNDIGVKPILSKINEDMNFYNNADIEKIKGCHSEKLESLLGYAPPYETVIHRDNLLIMR